MKKTITTALLCLVSGFLFAQELTKDELVEIISNESCECINGKGLDFEAIDKQKLELNFGLCIIESYTKHPEASELLNVSFNDDKSLEALGEVVALKMMTSCPDIMSLMVGNYLEDDSIATEAPQNNTLNGLAFLSLKSNQLFNTLSFKDTSNGRTYSFLWLEYFDGSQLFENEKKLKKQVFNIQYKEQDFYDPKINDYRNFKIITKLTVQ